MNAWMISISYSIVWIVSAILTENASLLHPLSFFPALQRCKVLALAHRLNFAQDINPVTRQKKNFARQMSPN